MSERAHHRPVLLEATLEWLRPRPGAVVVDGTVGLGGHAEAILERTAPDGRLIGLDMDEEALELARERLARFGDRVHLRRASFRRLRRELARLGPAGGAERVDGVLLDLGLSSAQLDRAERGFRFAAETAEEAPLDMRFDRRRGPTAAELLARSDEATLARWLRDYGELPGARRLARAIVAARREAPIERVADLLRVVREARVGGGRKHHPATRVFQALRIAVNDELAALEEGLEEATAALAPGGRLVAIAYHSLEDRRVKQLLRREERGCVCPPRQPVCTCGRRARLRRLTKRPVRPDAAELRANPRARSARLRAAERLEEAA